MRAALALAAFLVPAGAAAQGLGDTAARERHKREEKKAPPAKVFTNEDLSGAPQGSDEPPPEGPAEP